MSEFHDLRAICDHAQHGMRLDQALADVLQLSRRRSRRAIDEGGVYLNRKRCRTAGRTVSNGDALRVVLLDGEKLSPFSADQLIWQQAPLYLIHKQRDKQGRFHLCEQGRACETVAQVMKRRDKCALIRLIPHTGRTHQLRIHMAALGCPILGDTRYGGKVHRRLMLHAEKLSLTATGVPALPDTLTWNIPPQEDWQW